MIIRVKKKIYSEAVQAAPETLPVIRQWLSDSGFTEPYLDELVEARMWFLRDEGSKTVYLAWPHEFDQIFDIVEDNFKF